MAKFGDGWLASAYNTTPARFHIAQKNLSGLPGRSERFPNALATTWLFVTENPMEAERMITDVLAPMLGRDAELLRALPLPIGSAELCAERLNEYVRAGVQRIFLWPVAHQVQQLELFQDKVAPLIDTAQSEDQV